MAEADRNDKIQDAYNDRHGSEKETCEKVNEGKENKEPGRFTTAEVRKWYLEDDIGALKKQTGFNSYVPPPPRRTTRCTWMWSNTNLSSPRGHR